MLWCMRIETRYLINKDAAGHFGVVKFNCPCHSTTIIRFSLRVIDRFDRNYSWTFGRVVFCEDFCERVFYEEFYDCCFGWNDGFYFWLWDSVFASREEFY
ncbi:hypothetical protein D3C87_1579740 [compost metagenome]